MRMRKKKHGAERLALCSDIILDRNTESVFNLSEIFGNENELRLEIGCGKGKFICEAANKYPNINFIAVEKVSDVMLIACEGATAQSIQNVRFINADAENLEKYFPLHSFSALYLNFSDPWHKKRHAKRRLTYRVFLEKFKNFLAPGGKIYFKTDNRMLFDFSLEEFPAANYEIEYLTYDLHNSEMNAENIMTEYEKAFSEKGFSINFLIAKVK